MFEGALIETLEQLIDCRIELGEGEEGAVTKDGEDPAFDELDADLDCLSITPAKPCPSSTARPESTTAARASRLCGVVPDE